MLKFSNKSSVRESTTRFQCAQKHARRVIYKLNKFPLQKGTVNDYERHPFLVTIEKEKVLPQRSPRWYLIEKTLSLEKYKPWTVGPTGFMGRTLLALQNQSSFQKCLLMKLCKGYLNLP